MTSFTEMRCEIRDFKSKLIASGHRDGSLYYLDQGGPVHHACASSDHKSSKETIWHRRFDHLGAQGMQALMKNKMVSGMDFEWKQESDFCESCVEGKSHRLPFQQSTGKRTDSPLELIHSDVCGKIGTKSSKLCLPKAERSKIDSKTRKCVLLGYGTDQKGYRLYNFGQMKVIHSRDVVFDEESMPGIPKEDEPFSKYVELEFEEESVVEETATTNSPSSVPEVITVNEQLGEDSTTTNPTVPQSGLRRSTRNKQKPDWYSHNLTLLSTEQQDPSSITEAESSSDKTKWRKAMEMEMESLRSNEVWELVEPPPNRRVIGSKWVFKRKVDADGAVERYKARLVAQGCTQRFGLDYEETFSPVVRFESIRSVVSLGTQHKLQLHQMDVSAAFLHGELTEEVYMKQPEGFVEEGKEHLVCHLKRSIYGLKQSPRCWNHALDS